MPFCLSEGDSEKCVHLQWLSAGGEATWATGGECKDKTFCLQAEYFDIWIKHWMRLPDR